MMDRSGRDGRSSDLLAILLVDVNSALTRHTEAGDQISRRNLVRTVFAAVDGVSWLYREHVQDVLRKMGLLRLDEAIALSEVSYTVAETGKLATQPRHLSVSASVRLATRMAMRVDRSLVVDFSGANWAKFREAVTVRNRLTHPKAAEDLHVSRAEVSDCLIAFFWLLESVTDVMEASTHALKLHVQGMRKILLELKRGDPSAWAEYDAARKGDAGDQTMPTAAL